MELLKIKITYQIQLEKSEKLVVKRIRFNNSMKAIMF